MTRKRRRMIIVLTGLAMMSLATLLVLMAFQDNLVYFYGPTDLAAKNVPIGRRVRLGGLVEAGSVAHEADGHTIDFRVTDGKSAIPVTYGGIVPDLFREGQGVVVEGALQNNGILSADSVLAKHDEKYMPPEVVDALKKSGHWQEGAARATGP